MPRTASGFDFETWLYEYAFSREATARLGAYCRRYGLRPHEVDDVRQHWLEKLMGTIRRGVPETLTDPDQATPYALTAARRAAMELGCRGIRAHEDVLGAMEDDESSDRIERWASGDAADRSPEEELLTDEWCESVRGQITVAFRDGHVECSGCPAGDVVSLALRLVNAACESGDELGSLERWTADIRGGTTALGRELYQAMSQVVPERLHVGADGRVEPASRKYKSRCEPCVVDVLVMAIDGSPGHTNGEHADD